MTLGELLLAIEAAIEQFGPHEVVYRWGRDESEPVEYLAMDDGRMMVA